MIYQIHKTLKLPIGISQAWDFFSNPRNLSLITPPWLCMKILSELPDEIYNGLIIRYKVRPVLSIPLNWLTEISHVNEPHFFVDEQRYGPYRMWHHQHHFKEVPGGVIIEDIVDYVMPYGICGNFMHSLFIRNQLEKIFDFRASTLTKLFG